MTKLKASLIAQGLEQYECINYNDIFALIIR